MVDALEPMLSVAVTWWLPAVMFAGMVKATVNAPLASVVTVEFMSSELPSIDRVMFWPVPKPLPATLIALPLLAVVGIRTTEAMPIPGAAAVTFPGIVVVPFPGSAGKVSLLGDSDAAGSNVATAAVVVAAVVLPLDDAFPLPPCSTVNVAVAFSPVLPAAFMSWSPLVALAGMSAVVENSPVANCTMLPVRMYLSSIVNLKVCPGENPVPDMVTFVPVAPDDGFNVIDVPEAVSLAVAEGKEEVDDDDNAVVVSLPDEGIEEVSFLPIVVVAVSFPEGVCAAALLAVNPGATIAPIIAKAITTGSTVYLVVSNNMYLHQILHLRFS